jgi:hypothetical protein
VTADQLSEFAALRDGLVAWIDDVERFMEGVRPGDYGNAATYARVDIGHLLRNMRRGVALLEGSVLPLLDQDRR